MSNLLFGSLLSVPYWFLPNDIVAYDQSSCIDPPNLTAHCFDSNREKYGSISTTTTSIVIVFFGNWKKINYQVLSKSHTWNLPIIHYINSRAFVTINPNCSIIGLGITSKPHYFTCSYVQSCPLF